MEKDNFYKRLKDKMDDYAHLVYSLTRKFPKEEVLGITSQLRRATLSVVLNYIERYARSTKDKVYKNFIEISYGSLQESKYLLSFSFVENYLSEESYNKVLKLADETGAMLWGIRKNIGKECK